MTRPVGPARRALPLWAWSALVAAGAVAGCAGLVLAVAASRRALSSALVTATLAGGLVVVTVVAVAAAVLTARVGEALRALRADALSRLEDPSRALAPPRRSRLLGVAGTVELDGLARALDALHLRVRVADEVAERHRHTAETASVGMFELLSGLVAAEEATRGQLAAELHDTVAQSLLGARMLLADDRPDAVRRAAESVAEAEEQVRAVMARTRPPELRSGDLAEAVRGLRDDLARRYGLAVTVRWPQAPHPLPLATAVVVYRFFQEALLNVVKHTEGDAATLALVMGDDGLVASVSDEGGGFDPAGVRSEGGRHVGLGLLRERARLAGGGVDVVSAPGVGTRVVLRLPASALAGAVARPRLARSARHPSPGADHSPSPGAVPAPPLVPLAARADRGSRLPLRRVAAGRRPG